MGETCLEDYIKTKVKEQGKEFYSSDEYRQIYPHLKNIHKHKEEKHLQEAFKALSESGQKIGDRVFYDLLGAFFVVTALEGIIVRRGHTICIKLDEKFNGKRFIRWHKGFKKSKERKTHD